MSNKEVIIIVPGAKDLSAWPKLIQDIVIFLSRIFKFRPTYTDHVQVWKKKLVFKRKEVVWMHWGRGIGFISKWFAKRKLRRLLNHYEHHRVKLVGISLGGDIILEAIRSCKFGNIKKGIFDKLS